MHPLIPLADMPRSATYPSPPLLGSPRHPLLAAPAAALVLGLAGLVPFVALAGLAIFLPDTGYLYWLTTLAQYAAVIASFVGALQWGYAVRESPQGAAAWARYGWSVGPALVAWASFQFPIWTTLRVLAATLVLCAVVDRAFARIDGAPPWLLPLRYLLTAIGAACLLAASYA